MKRTNHYIALLLCIAMGFTACNHLEPELFDEGADGAYFDYEYATDFERTLNFADHIVDNPDTVAVSLRVKLLGYLKDEGRTLAVKTREITGYALADVSIDDVIFSNREYEKEIVVKVRRPIVEDSIFAVCIYLDGSGDIGESINGKDSINLYVTESYMMPSVWYSHVETYLGSWSKEKHCFLAQHKRNNYYYDNLYDKNSGMHIFDSIVALNVSAVNALLASKPSEPISIDLPILKESDYPAYTEPYFWADYEQYLGGFRAGKFCRFTTIMGGSDTQDIIALYASDEAKLKMEEEAVDFHKDDVIYMLNQYYQYASQGIPLSRYKALYWVEIRNNVNYTMRIPYWWEDPNVLGTAAVVKKYFGEYTADKYQFMLKTIMKEDGETEFVAASIFPFVRKGDTYTWDDTPFGKEQLSGEARLKECYRLIKAANDKRPASRRFDIPEVENI